MVCHIEGSGITLIPKCKYRKTFLISNKRKNINTNFLKNAL